MSYSPEPDAVLRSVIGALENEIGPATTSDHAASLCRTAAQMLRHVVARSELEMSVLLQDEADLRILLAENDIEADRPPELRWPDIDEERAHVAALEARLAAVVAVESDFDAPVRIAARGFVAAKLKRRLPWERDAFTGPRR